MDPLGAEEWTFASGPQSFRQLWGGGVLLAACEESVSQTPSSVSVCSFILGAGGLGASNRGKASPPAL